MNQQQALMLVRAKWMDETKGKIDGPNAENYQNACREFPAMMAVAHIMWAEGFKSPGQSRA